MTEKTSPAGRAWRVFVVLVLVAAVVAPIYGAVFDGGLGLIAGMYIGLILAAIGIALLAGTFAVESMRRRKQPPPDKPVELPRARINR